MAKPDDLLHQLVGLAQVQPPRAVSLAVAEQLRRVQNQYPVPGGTAVPESAWSNFITSPVSAWVLSGAAKLLIGQFFREMERQVRDRTP